MSPSKGTFTYVFTDIEGSTRHLRALGDAYIDVLRAHDQIIETAARAHGGSVFGSEGDAQNLVFEDATGAIRAAAEVQRSLAAHTWPEGHTIRVRMGIHSGTAQRLGDDFVGMVLHETARIASAGHGGQVLISAATRELVQGTLPQDLALRDLGEHGLKDLGHPVRIYQLDIDGLTHDFPPLRSSRPAEIRLPTQVTSFVGRAEVEAVMELSAKARLLTLTGPGGTGKTRLAIAAASEIASRFADGVFFVAVDAVADASLVTSEIATVLGLAGGQGPPLERVIEHLRDRHVLLVLDNLEQVIDAAPEIARIISDCEHVHIIATSRIPLQVYGEHEFQVPALAVPASSDELSSAEAMGFEAVRLFAERAVAARPDFVMRDEDTRTIVDIVDRLDGLPLAIELAAARLRMLPLVALHDRLDDSLSVLTGGGRDRPTRQQTLRGAIAWSYDLLDGPDRRLFARYGVFASSATFDLVEQICGPADEIGREVFEGIESLSDQSLLRLVDLGSEPRFAMLATIREFAVERLRESGEEALLRQRHAEAYLALASEAAPALIGLDGPAWNDRLETHHDDLRAALEWAIEVDDAATGLRLATALWRFWQVRGHLFEAAAWFDRLLALPSVPSQPAELRARAEGAAGGVDYWRADVAAAHQHYVAALELARATEDPRLLAESLYNLGFAASEDLTMGNRIFVVGRPYFEEALAAYRDLGDRAGEASALWALHQAAHGEGDLDEAARLGVEALALARELDDPFRTGWAAYSLGIVQTVLGRLPEALALFDEAVDVFSAARDTGGIAMSVFAIAHGALLFGETDAGWRLAGATARMTRESGAGLGSLDPEIEGIDLKRTPETPEEVRAYEEGARLSDDEAVALARSLIERIRTILSTQGQSG